MNFVKEVDAWDDALTHNSAWNDLSGRVLWANQLHETGYSIERPAANVARAIF